MSNPLDRKLIEYDPQSQSGLQFFHDASTNISGVRQVQRTDDILEANLRQRAEPNFRKNGEDFRHVARIPLVVLNELIRKGITKDPRAMKRWLNDRDNRPFRTNEEHL